MGTVSQTVMAILLMAVPTAALDWGNPTTNAAAAYESGFEEVDPEDLEDYDLPDYIDDSGSDDGGDSEEYDQPEDDWLDDPDDLIDELGDYDLGDLGGSFSTWGTDVDVHSEPSTDAEVVEVLTEPTTVAVSCQLQGELLSAEGYSNDWWTYPPELDGYISNIYIDIPESVLPGVADCNEAEQGDASDEPGSENPEWRRLRDEECLDEYFEKDGKTYRCTSDGPVKVSPYSCYDTIHKQDRAIFGVDGPPTEWFVNSQFNCTHWNYNTLGDGCPARGEFIIQGYEHGEFVWTGYDMCPDGGRPLLEVRDLAGEWFSYKSGPPANEGAGRVRFLVGGIDVYRFSWRGAKTESFKFGKKYPNDGCFGDKDFPREIPCPDKPQDWLPPLQMRRGTADSRNPPIGPHDSVRCRTSGLTASTNLPRRATAKNPGSPTPESGTQAVGIPTTFESILSLATSIRRNPRSFDRRNRQGRVPRTRV